MDARVLDPRPDTETLVDWALEAIAPCPPRAWPTWAPAVAPLRWHLQSQRPTAQVLAVDASADALAVAQANAQRLGLPVRFAHGNWLHG